MVTYEFDDRNNKVYEIDEKGNRQLVRSTESTRRAFFRFRNKTTRVIDVWWRDYGGSKCHYKRIPPGRFCDMNSFTTHPWEFTDAATGERYVINNQPIFRAPPELGGMDYRTNWNITIGMRTLRKTAMLAINNFLRDVDDINVLEIPRRLAEELQAVMISLRRPLPPAPTP
ncbi:von Hippel-Lindau disease tumor suppressor [Aricia agestis]|uniref:von Hippel-Lindau disease tumor suppressor n=1 Tax=Aricia agestis TaxID=91739 RepID=UPI001C208A1C|nr:von Hippel-Lindau disease tumor suppressor [Aricia agestis]